MAWYCIAGIGLTIFMALVLIFALCQVAGNADAHIDAMGIGEGKEEE
jgi:hypothetical protein